MLERRFGAVGIQCDVTNSESTELFGKANFNCDVLVNNAGISQIKLITDVTDSEWRRMLDVNLTGAFIMSRRVLPNMIHRKSGSIVNISSVWGVVGASCEVHYSAAKAGLIGFTKALAKEVGPSGIRVNCIAPGVIAGKMNSRLTRSELALLADETPLGRIGTAREVAGAVRFIAGAGFITGQVLGVDGGFGV